MIRAERSRLPPSWPLLVLLVLLGAALGCGPKPSPRAADSEIEPIYDPAGGGEQRVETVESAPAAQCRTPRRSEQLRVGFRTAIKGGDSELTAAEAPRIVSVLQARLCELEPKQDPEGSLRTALGAGLLLEISALTFTRKDASRADVQVQLVSSASASPDGRTGSKAAAELVAPPRWVLKLVRDEDSGWRIASAAAK